MTKGQSAAIRVVSRVALAVAVLVGAVGFGPVTASGGASTGSLDGIVLTAGVFLAGADVELFVGDHDGARSLATATTDAGGQFSVSYERPTGGVLYVEARSSAHDKVVLVAVVGVVGDGGGVEIEPLAGVIVNELTTVATSYAMAQFQQLDGQFWGPSPGLENAGATAFNLANSASGAPADVVTNADNGSSNETLATMNTLANLIAVCTTAVSDEECYEVADFTTPRPHEPGPPWTTVTGLVSLAKHPRLGVDPLYALAQISTTYQPDLDAQPEAWVLALHYTAGGFGAPGRPAIDAKGNLWINNNWKPGTTESGLNVTVLNPVGTPILDSPIQGGGIFGSGWGAAIDLDDNIWFSNFANGTMSKFAPDGTPLSPDEGWTQGNLLHPQGIAVDRFNNIWIANGLGEDSSSDDSSVVVYVGGDPDNIRTITGGGIHDPFSVQIDDRDRAWVTNAGTTGRSVTVIGPDFEPTDFSPIEDASVRSPHGLAFDSQGNAWVASFESHEVALIHPAGTVDPASPFDVPGGFGPWGIAIDGDDHVWVGGFLVPGVAELCGLGPASASTHPYGCGAGSEQGHPLSPLLGFQSSSLQHITAVQIDPSGNVWAANNWDQLEPRGPGDGMVEFIGMAAPVCTPLFGLPVAPELGVARACPDVSPAAPPTTTTTPTAAPTITTTAPATPVAPPQPIAPVYTG